MSSLSEARDGIADLWPAMAAAVPIGLLYGAVCAAKGLTPAEVAASSALIFAGSAQFAAIEIWRWPPPLLALAVSTLLINARHVLMGASLAPKTGAFAPWQRWLGFAVMADENWAFAERRAAQRVLMPGYFLGAGAAFWLNWLAWTTLGALVGPLMGDPRRLGADFAFTALFIGLIAGAWKGRATAVTVAASGIAAALAYRAFGAPWHVLAGALAGIGAAFLAGGRDAR